MLSSDLDEITVEDVYGLIENEVPERRRLEFKRELDPDNTNHKQKFLAEITSFANTSGGDLLIGVPDPDDVEDEDDEKLWWITDYDPDEYKLKWENIVRTNTQPGLNSHEIRAIQNPDGEGFIVAVRVLQSTISPHRVTLKSKKPFYARNSTGKYPLDVEQLREKFIEQYRLTEEIELFLAERIAKIRSGDTPAPFEAGPAMVLHVIPATAFSLQPEIDISSDKHEMPGLPLFQRDGGRIHGSARRNVDGIVKSQDIGDFKKDSHGEPESEYVQLFRDGRIEAVHSSYFRKFIDDEKKLGFQKLYDVLHDRLPDYTGFLHDRDVRPPLFLYLTFIDAEGFVLSADRDSKELDRDIATLPPVSLKSYDVSVEEVTKEMLTHVWHAFGEFGDPFEHLEIQIN